MLGDGVLDILLICLYVMKQIFLVYILAEANFMFFHTFCSPSVGS